MVADLSSGEIDLLAQPGCALDLDVALLPVAGAAQVIRVIGAGVLHPPAPGLEMLYRQRHRVQLDSPTEGSVGGPTLASTLGLARRRACR